MADLRDILSGIGRGLSATFGGGGSSPPFSGPGGSLPQNPFGLPTLGIPIPGTNTVIPFGQGPSYPDATPFGPNPSPGSSSTQQQPTTPGGYTGYITPAGGSLAVPNFGNNRAVLASLVMSGQIPAMQPALRKIVTAAPPGYVIIQTPQGPRSILKPVAYALGLKKKPVKRAILSRRDIQGAHRVNRIIGEYSVHRKPKLQLKSGKKKGAH